MQKVVKNHLCKNGLYDVCHVLVASNNFSNTTVKLNAINDSESRKSTLSSGSV